MLLGLLPLRVALEVAALRCSVLFMSRWFVYAIDVLDLEQVNIPIFVSSLVVLRLFTCFTFDLILLLSPRRFKVIPGIFRGLEVKRVEFKA